MIVLLFGLGLYGGASFIAKKLFDGHGMSIDDVQWERLAYPDMLVAMGNRAVEVGWVLEPFLTLGKQRGVLVPWLSLGEYDPGHQLAGIIYDGHMPLTGAADQQGGIEQTALHHHVFGESPRTSKLYDRTVEHPPVQCQNSPVGRCRCPQSWSG